MLSSNFLSSLGTYIIRQLFSPLPPTEKMEQEKPMAISPIPQTRIKLLASHSKNQTCRPLGSITNTFDCIVWLSHELAGKAQEFIMQILELDYCVQIVVFQLCDLVRLNFSEPQFMIYKLGIIITPIS